MRNYKKYMRYVNKGIIVKLIGGWFIMIDKGTERISCTIRIEGQLFHVHSYNYNVKGETHSKTDIREAFKDEEGLISPLGIVYFNRKASATSIDHVKEVITRFIEARDNVKVVFKESK